MYRQRDVFRSLAILGLGLGFWGAVQAADPTAPVIEAGEERLQQAQEAQEAIDQIHGETESLEEEYRQRLQQVDDLELYNELLNRKLENQNREMDKLEASIKDATQIERRILPLLDRMITTLREFIELDIPFLMEERTSRVDDLRNMLERSDVSVAEKVRRVFEAYQIEGEYGRSIEAYTTKLSVDGDTFDAEILRVGRIAMLYLGLGGERAGYWNPEDRTWIADTDRAFLRHVENGLKVARKEVAPELLTVPAFVDRGGD